MFNPRMVTFTHNLLNHSEKRKTKNRFLNFVETGIHCGFNFKKQRITIKTDSV